MPRLSDLAVKLFTDGADKAQILNMAKQAWIKGFTTNPSLLKKAGVSDYAAFGRDLVAAMTRLTPSRRRRGPIFLRSENPYSITSSARPRNVIGKVRSSTFSGQRQCPRYTRLEMRRTTISISVWATESKFLKASALEAPFLRSIVVTGISL